MRAVTCMPRDRERERDRETESIHAVTILREQSGVSNQAGEEKGMNGRLREW